MSDDGALAPVIPLFGGAAAAAPAGHGTDAAAGSEQPDDGTWHTTWTAPADARRRFPERGTAIDGAETGGVGPARVGRSGAVTVDVADADVADREGAAEAALLRKLRTRSLSVREARAVLRDHDLDEVAADGVLDRFLDLGYLDDARLAEQLIHSAVERKGQGRMAVSQGLAKRGIPRDVIDAALSELPDDERERAVEFARTKARSMRGLDREVAVRRLVGQLARRGYGSHALDAARTALDEASRPARGVVRFEP